MTFSPFFDFRLELTDRARARVGFSHTLVGARAVAGKLGRFRRETFKNISQPGRAFAVKVEGKRLPVSPFSGLLKGCKCHKTHRFENGGTNQIRKTGKQEVVFLQPLPQTL